MTTMTILRVVAKRDGFRRAGFVFGSQPRDVPLDALTDAQRTAIVRDPMLLATEVEIADHTEALADAPNLGTGQASAIDPSAHAALKLPVAGRKRK